MIFSEQPDNSSTVPLVIIDDLSMPALRPNREDAAPFLITRSALDTTMPSERNVMYDSRIVADSQFCTPTQGINDCLPVSMYNVLVISGAHCPPDEKLVSMGTPAADIQAVTNEPYGKIVADNDAIDRAMRQDITNMYKPGTQTPSLAMLNDTLLLPDLPPVADRILETVERTALIGLTPSNVQLYNAEPRSVQKALDQGGFIAVTKIGEDSHGIAITHAVYVPPNVPQCETQYSLAISILDRYGGAPWY